MSDKLQMNTALAGDERKVVVYLFALDALAALAAVGKVLEDGGERRDTDAAADEHRHLVLVPVLVTLAVRPVQVDLKCAGHSSCTV